jgi:hypothetical protein
MNKAVLTPDHFAISKYDILVEGGPPLVFNEITWPENELDTVELPDRTWASGGREKPFEFTAMHPVHQAEGAEEDFLVSWKEQGKDPVDPEYKKNVTLVIYRISGEPKSYYMSGVFPFKDKNSDLDMNNEGEQIVNEWSFKGDSITRG